MHIALYSQKSILHIFLQREDISWSQVQRFGMRIDITLLVFFVIDTFSVT